MSPDHYESTLPSKELDRRERVAADVRGARKVSALLAAVIGAVEDELAQTAPDSPVYVALEDVFIALMGTPEDEGMRDKLERRLNGIEGGRYQYVEAQRSPEAVGIAAQADLGKLLTGGR